MSIRAILRDVVIVWVATFFGGVIVGVVSATQDLSSSAFGVGLLVANLTMTTVALTLSACLAKTTNRWAHIAWVAFGAWLTGLMSLFFGVTLITWFLGSVPIAVCTAAAGGLSFVFRPTSGRS